MTKRLVIDVGLAHKPEVILLTAKLGEPAPVALGRLLTFWCYAAAHEEGGVITETTAEAAAVVADRPSLHDAMLAVGLLERDPDAPGTLRLQAWDEMGPNGVRRELDRRRKAGGRKPATKKKAAKKEKPKDEAERTVEGHSEHEWVELLREKAAPTMPRLSRLGSSWSLLERASRNFGGTLWEALGKFEPRPLSDFYQNWGKVNWHWILERKGKLEEYLEGVLSDASETSRPDTSDTSDDWEPSEEDGWEQA